MLGFLKRTFFLPFTGLTLIGCAEPGDGADDARFEKSRGQMVERQLRGRDITDESVLQAMRKVPRHHFVPAELRHRAYDDSALPIGHEQTISQPYIVALMSQKLELKPGEKVLEIGTGSGYQAAVLAEMKAEVFSIEIVTATTNPASPARSPPLSATATQGSHHILLQTPIDCGSWPCAGSIDTRAIGADSARRLRPHVAIRGGRHGGTRDGGLHRAVLHRLPRRRDQAWRS